MHGAQAAKLGSSSNDSSDGVWRSGPLPCHLVPVGDGCLSDPATGVHRVVVDTNVTDRAADFARTYRRSHAAIDAIDFLVAATAELHATSF